MRNAISWRNGRDHYGVVPIAFHWTVALGFAGLIGLEAWMVEFTYYDPWYNVPLALHNVIGIVVLIPALARLGWRLADRRPGFEAELTSAERLAATAMHRLLGALTVLLPVTGCLISTSEGSGVDMFGLVEVPASVPVSAGMRDIAINVHFHLAYGTIGLIALHAGAAFKHHFLDGGSWLGACAAEKVLPYVVRREPKERVRCRRRSAPTSRTSCFCLRRTCTNGSRRDTWRTT